MDFYDVLGVPRNASADDIARAYRAKARKHHPDMHSGSPEQDKHAALFKQVQAAYAVLSDPHKKAQYDVRGYAGTGPRPSERPKEKPKPKTKEDFERERAKQKYERDFRSEKESDFSHIKCSFFGTSATGRNVMVQVPLTKAEMSEGCWKMVPIKKRFPCERCIGDGKSNKLCQKCRAMRPHVNWCQTCEGQGVLEVTCPNCNGEGVKLWGTESVKVVFPAKCSVGSAVNVHGQGELAPNKMPGYVRAVVVDA